MKNYDLNTKKENLEKEITNINNKIKDKENSKIIIDCNRDEINRLKKEYLKLFLIIVPLLIISLGATTVYLIKSIPLLVSMFALVGSSVVLNINTKNYISQVKKLNEEIKKHEKNYSEFIDYNYYNKLQNELNKINNEIIKSVEKEKVSFPVDTKEKILKKIKK